MISPESNQFQLEHIEFQDLHELLHHKFSDLLNYITLKPGSPQVMQYVQQQLVSSFVIDLSVRSPLLFDI